MPADNNSRIKSIDSLNAVMMASSPSYRVVPQQSNLQLPPLSSRYEVSSSSHQSIGVNQQVSKNIHSIYTLYIENDLK